MQRKVRVGIYAIIVRIFLYGTAEHYMVSDCVAEISNV